MDRTLKDIERTFSEDTLLVTKTDLKGIITYANHAFINIVQMDEDTLIGSAHNVIRHPDMPKIIFKLLWSYIQDGKEIHAYVKNCCADGSFYWVMANVTPSYDTQTHTQIIGYHSSRRVANPKALEIIKPLYEKLLSAEKTGGMGASERMLNNLLKEKGISYDEFVLSI